MSDEVTDALRRVRSGTAARKVGSPTLDFKAPSSRVKDTLSNLADASVCFANAAGGTIVLGVTDDVPGPGAFVGTSLGRDLVRHGIYERTSPALDVVVSTEAVDGVELLRISVPEGLEVVSTTTGRYAWRRGTDCMPMTADDVARLREERRGEDWSSRSSGTDARPAVDPAAVVRLRELLGTVSTDGAAALLKGADDELIAGLGLVTRHGKLTNAGVVLLQRRADLDDAAIIYQHRRVSSGEPDAVLHIRGPVIVALQRLIDAIELRLTSTPLNLVGGQQLQIPDFPLAAVREAVMNAVAHGDYRTGRPIQVEHSPDWLAVTSPGPLVAGVTPENILRHPHRARFRTIFGALRHIGLVEQVGLGVDRMYREMLRVGRNPPRISEGRDQVTVTFASDEPNLRVARFVNQLGPARRDDLDVLLVLAILRRRRSVAAPAVAVEIQRSVEDAQVLLRRMSDGDQPVLEPTEGSSHRRLPNYRLRGSVLADLGSAVSYHRAPSHERDRKIIEHLHEYGSINNRTVQNLFDVDVYRGSAILRDLVEREIVVRTSEQTRGNAVKYGPGPAFAEPSRRGRGHRPR